MSKPAIPENEESRLKALKDFKILDTSANESFDDLTYLAATICGAPISLISLIDENRQWFKSKRGTDISESPRDYAFCAHAINEKGVLHVGDATQDIRFSDNPLVAGEPGVRFYCGTPLVDDNGFSLGTLCVIDLKPRTLSDEQVKLLEALGRQVMGQMKLHAELERSKDSLKTSQRQEELLRSYFDSSSLMMGVVELQNDTIVHISDNQATAQFFGIENQSTSHKTASAMGAPQRYERLWIEKYKESQKTRTPIQFIYEHKTDQNSKWVQATVNFLPNTSGQFARFSYIADDVSRKVLQDQLVLDQQRNLAQSAKMASLGLMAGGIAHEINNPLAVIGGRAQQLRFLMSKIHGAKEAMAALDKIDATVERIAKIVKGLLSFSRLDESSQFESINLNYLVESTFELCRERFRKQKVIFRNTIPKEIMVSCFPTQISQVIMNLLNKSYDAILEKPDMWIEISAREKKDFIEITAI